jgi:hypothetical protein
LENLHAKRKFYHLTHFRANNCAKKVEEKEDFKSEEEEYVYDSKKLGDIRSPIESSYSSS